MGVSGIQWSFFKYKNTNKLFKPIQTNVLLDCSVDDSEHTAGVSADLWRV